MMFPPKPHFRTSIPVFLTLWIGISCVGFTDSSSADRASGILFSENFENLPTQQVKSQFGQEGASVLENGPSPCGKFSTGIAADFKSPNVDFQSSQNASHFVAMNPESPCGGAYQAHLVLSPLDFSGWDSVEFKARYFRMSVPTWGTDFSVLFYVPGASFKMDTTAMPSVGKWDTFSIKLPASMLKSEVKVSIYSALRLGLDDIQFVGYRNGVGSIRNSARTRSVTNLHSAKTFDLLGSLLSTEQNIHSKTRASSRTGQAGTYLIRTEFSNGETGLEKITIK